MLYKRTSLSNLADYINGMAFKPSDWKDEGAKIIRIEQLNNPKGSFDYFQGYFPESNAIDNEDLIFSWSATLKVVIWKYGKGVLNQHLFKVIPYTNTDKYFLHQLLDFHMDKLAESSHGSTMKHIKRGELDKYKVVVPTDKQEQSKIANILSICDEVIEKTEETIEKYKQIKAGMIQDLFTRGLDANGKLRPIYEQSPDLYKYAEELDRYIPKDWDIKKLNEIGDIVTGSTPSTQNLSYYGDEYMFVSPADIDEDRYIKITLKNLSLKGFNISRKIPANSVCVVCIGSTIGKEAISKKECTTNQQINTIIPFNSNFSLYYYYSTCLYLKKQFDANVGLQAVPIVNKSNFEEFYIPESQDEKEVVKIQSIVNQFDEKIEKEEQYLNKYKQIKQGLMKRLLTPPADAEIVEE